MLPFPATVALALLAHQPPQAPSVEGPPPEHIDLSWNAPPECPSSAEVEALYRGMLSAPPQGEGTLIANARVLQHGPRLWSLRLTTAFAGASHTRELEAAACGELAEAVAMVFAVALEPGLTQETPAPAAAVTVDRTSASASAAPEPRAPSRPGTDSPAPKTPAPHEPVLSPPPRRQRGGPDVMGRVSLGAERGALPGAAAYPSLGLGLQWRRAQLEGDVSWLSPRSASAPASASIRAQSVQGALRGCFALHDHAFRIPVCLGAEAGRVFARSAGLAEDTRVRGPWFAIGPRVGVAYRWRHVGVSVAAEAMRSVVTTRLRVEEVPVFSPAAFSVRGIASLEFFFRAPPP